MSFNFHNNSPVDSTSILKMWKTVAENVNCPRSHSKVRIQTSVYLNLNTELLATESCLLPLYIHTYLILQGKKSNT